MGRFKTKIGHVSRATKSSWSTDASRFGKKMIEQMGWQEGKGLGRHENGTVDPIKASYKFDQKGLGFAEDPAEKFKAVDDYSSILANINQIFAKPSFENDSPEKFSSSKLFIKGRNVSEKDYQCIFGKPKPSTKPVKKPKTPKSQSPNQEENFTIKSELNSVDYFAKKYAEKMAKLKGLKVELTPPVQHEIDADDERPSFQLKEEPPQEFEETSNHVIKLEAISPSSEESCTTPRSILSRTPKNFVYTKGQTHSGRKIRFSKQVNLLHLDLNNNSIRELVFVHQKNTSVMSQFREFNKENSEPSTPDMDDQSEEKSLENGDIADFTEELEPDSTPNCKVRKKKKSHTQEALECLDDLLLANASESPSLPPKKKKKSVKTSEETTQSCIEKEGLVEPDKPLVSKRKKRKRKLCEDEALSQEADKDDILLNCFCSNPKKKKRKHLLNLSETLPLPVP